MGSLVAASGCQGIANLRTLPFHPHPLPFVRRFAGRTRVRVERPKPSNSIVRKSLQLHLC
jgi:hypothetical protein